MGNKFINANAVLNRKGSAVQQCNFKRRFYYLKFTKQWHDTFYQHAQRKLNVILVWFVVSWIIYEIYLRIFFLWPTGTNPLVNAYSVSTRSIVLYMACVCVCVRWWANLKMKPQPQRKAKLKNNKKKEKKKKRMYIIFWYKSLPDHIYIYNVTVLRHNLFVRPSCSCRMSV